MQFFRARVDVIYAIFKNCHPERSRGTCFYGVSMEKNYHVYLLSSRSHALYTGITNDLMSRVGQHREGKISSFTAKYRIHRLVYFETFHDVRAAIAREKQIKSWTREKRVELIRANNPTWLDLAAEWFSPYPRKAGPSASLGMTGFGGDGKKMEQSKAAAVGTAKAVP